MSLNSKNVTASVYSVTGPISKNLSEVFIEGLKKMAFHSIEDNSDEFSCGWTHFGDMNTYDFGSLDVFMSANIFMASIRHDKRKLPAALLKAKLKQEIEKYIRKNPGQKRISKQSKEELKEKIKNKLLLKTLPVPNNFDVVWNIDTGVLLFGTTNQGERNAFESVFVKTFDGLTLELDNIDKRAALILDTKNDVFNEKTSDEDGSVGEWLGRKFLAWLLYKTLHDSSTYNLTKTGVFPSAEPFTAFIDEKVILEDETVTGKQKLVSTGGQGAYKEVLAAVKEGKKITEATLVFEKEHLTWRVYLKAKGFQITSIKIPTTPVDDEDDSSDDNTGYYTNMATMVDRLYYILGALQIFDNLLLSYFEDRMSSDWNVTAGKINNIAD